MSEKKQLPAQLRENETAAFRRVQGLLNSLEVQIKKALPNVVRPEQFLRVALTSCRKNPLLLQATDESLASALLEAAQVGLICDGITGQGHLVPFYNSKRKCYEVQFIPGYRGLITLAYRSGQVQLVEPRMVFEGDRFVHEFGLEPKLVHVPTAADQRGEWTHVYCVVTMVGGFKYFDVMHKPDVLRIRDHSPQYSRTKRGPWADHEWPMAVKTGVRRALKYIPQAPDPLVRAISQDELNESDEPRVPEYEVAATASATAAPKEEQEPKPGEVRTVEGDPYVWIDKDVGWVPQHVAEKVASERSAGEEEGGDEPEGSESSDLFEG